VQFTCWEAEGANHEGKEIDKIPSNIWVLNAVAQADVVVNA
jgi:hypothetical protein